MHTPANTPGIPSFATQLVNRTRSASVRAAQLMEKLTSDSLLFQFSDGEIVGLKIDPQFESFIRRVQPIHNAPVAIRLFKKIRLPSSVTVTA